jgi:hypothetical protein
MKIKSGILLWLAALAALAFGLLLPSIVYKVQNEGSAASSQQYMVDTIQLEMSKPAPVSDKLLLVSTQNHTMSLDNGNKLSKETAYQAALAFLTFMQEHGVVLDPQAYTSHTAIPVLTFTQDSQNAAVIWECALRNPNNDSFIVIRLDDETGKMLSFIFSEYEFSIQSSDGTATVLSADDWGNLCVEYYGFKSVTVNRATMVSTDGNNWVTQECTERKYSLVFTDYDGEELSLSFREYSTPSASDQDTVKVTVDFNFK